MNKEDDEVRKRGFRLILVCAGAVGLGSAADACGVTNKESDASQLKPSSMMMTDSKRCLLVRVEECEAYEESMIAV